MHYLKVLGVTLLFELLVIALYTFWRKREEAWWILTVALGANLLTHGLFYLSFRQIPGAFVAKLTLFEVAITLVEAVLYCVLGRLKLVEALLLSLVANVASLVGGVILQRL